MACKVHHTCVGGAALAKPLEAMRVRAVWSTREACRALGPWPLWKVTATNATNASHSGGVAGVG